ncbi:hypothetical protein FJTKL_09086 [Diaporthe vaccinii]|uniref:Fungal N-terminal domain-containing protein n=1 Tax=Diaporthe vaccinii TaxID=105482 RepID=A0ABR4EPM7_9PEZI
MHDSSPHPMAGASCVSHTASLPSRAFEIRFSAFLPHLSTSSITVRPFFNTFVPSLVHNEANMAEILGAVASGLAVAEVGLKVGGTVSKLKKLWQEVHDVPATIQYLMRQIEMMDPILSDHETNLDIQTTALPRQLLTCNGAPATQSTTYCREALNDLQRLAEDLDVALESEKRSRRTFARTRVVLKKETIKEFQYRLERAIRLLQWTQVNYLAANATITGNMVTDMWTMVTNTQAQQQVILQQLGNSNRSSSSGRPPLPVVTQHIGKSRGHNLNKRKRVHNSVYVPWLQPSIFGAIIVRKSEADSGDGKYYAARIQLPKWLSQKVWNINITRACSGWQGTLSTWNIVPRDSPGMICVRKGDLDGLIDLFDRGLASPQDCNDHGDTIFNGACVRSHTHIVNYFIDMNLDIMSTTAMGIATVFDVFEGTMPINVIRKLSSRGFFNSLANATEDFELYNETVEWNGSHIFSACCLVWASRRQELFELCLRAYFPIWLHC